MEKEPYKAVVRLTETEINDLLNAIMCWRYAIMTAEDLGYDISDETRERIENINNKFMALL